MNIYIYGSQKFVKEINRLLNKSNIRDNIEHIKSLDILKNTIKDKCDEIFIIDDNKIIYNTIFEKINPFKVKDAIKKDFLNKYGVGDLCFNSFDGFIKFILNRLEVYNANISNDINEEELSQNSVTDNINEDIQNEQTQRDIITIDDIPNLEMEEAIKELKIQEDKKD